MHYWSRAEGLTEWEMLISDRIAWKSYRLTCFQLKINSSQSSADFVPIVILRRYNLSLELTLQRAIALLQIELECLVYLDTPCDVVVESPNVKELKPRR